jgi:4-hydroxy-3-methylbut-2-enyl diphosphate reductase IspH
MDAMLIVGGKNSANTSGGAAIPKAGNAHFPH